MTNKKNDTVKKVAVKKKTPTKKVTRKKSISRSKTVTQDVAQSQDEVPLQPMQRQDPASDAPYPLPMQTGGSAYGGGYGQSGDTMVSLNNMKTLWKSKNFWGAVSMFALSGLTLMGNLPAFSENPTVMSIVGMAFALLWILFRMTTNQAITPSVNMPHPGEWMKKKTGGGPR